MRTTHSKLSPFATVKKFLSDEWKDSVLLFRSIPSLVVSLFFLSVVCMNLLANKELLSFRYLALDCGFTLSWFSFLCMDMICKRFGPKAAVKVSIAALFVNLCVFLLFHLLSKTPGMWGEFYSYADSSLESANIANNALNATFGGTWYVVFGSALAMFLSSIVNAAANHWIAARIRSKGFKNFALRSYASTMLAQFVDNAVFALVVSHIFFGWNMTQVLLCSLTGAVFELLCEIVFSPIGYKMCLRWESEGVGDAYLKFQGEKG